MLKIGQIWSLMTSSNLAFDMSEENCRTRFVMIVHEHHVPLLAKTHGNRDRGGQSIAPPPAGRGKSRSQAGRGHRPQVNMDIQRSAQWPKRRVSFFCVHIFDKKWPQSKNTSSILPFPLNETSNEILILKKSQAKGWTCGHSWVKPSQIADREVKLLSFNSGGTNDHKGAFSDSLSHLERELLKRNSYILQEPMCLQL